MLVFLAALLIVAMATLSTQAAEESAPPAVGETAPDFTLQAPGEEGEEFTLSTALEEGPVVILVLRGWPGYQCPICTRQVGAFIGDAQKFAEARATVVMIYPGPEGGLEGHAEEFFAPHNLPANFRYVIDPDYTFTNAWNLRWNAPRETAYPATFVVNTDREIEFAHVSDSHGGRTEPEEVLRALP